MACAAMLLLAASVRAAGARSIARSALRRAPRAALAGAIDADARWHPALEGARQRRWPLPSADAAAGLGRALARVSAPGDVILLVGEVGMGKSTLARGFLKEVARDELLTVSSPSYLLDITYPDPSGSSLLPGVTVHHMDLWRLPPGQIAALVDLPAVFEREVSLIEWPDRLGAAAPGAARCLVVELVQLEAAAAEGERRGGRAAPGAADEGDEEEGDEEEGEGEDEPRCAYLRSYDERWWGRVEGLGAGAGG